MAIYVIKGLQEKIRIWIGLSTYDRRRMLEALQQAEGKGESEQRAIVGAVLDDLERRADIEIRLRPQRDETM